MINLPTDTLYKFSTFLVLVVLSASIYNLVVIDDKRTTAQISARAALVEHVELLKQTAEIIRLATNK